MLARRLPVREARAAGARWRRGTDGGTVDERRDGGTTMRGGRRWVWRGAAALLAATVLAALALLGLVRIAGWGTLPEPPGQAQVRLLAGDRELAVFQGPPGQRQLWVPLPEVPQAVVNAVL